MRVTEGTAPAATGVALSLRLRLALVLFWRARTLPLRLPRDLPFGRMLALATPPEGAPLRGLAADEIALRVHRATRHPILMRDRRCLREGVLCFRFLRMAGFDPRLHFGIDPASPGRRGLGAHCWVTLGDRTLAGDLGVPMIALHVHGGEDPAQTAATTGPGRAADAGRAIF